MWFDNQPLLKFELGEVQIYPEDNPGGLRFPSRFDWSQSIMPLMVIQEMTRLTWFRERMERFIIVKINPVMMHSESSREEMRLFPRMENFVSWYRFLSQDQGKIFEVTNALREILDGFAYFKFIESGLQKRILKLYFSVKGNSKEYIDYSFWELSDGQRMLIALYTLIYCTQSDDYTLCIDEPENFLALPEIQPWLIKLYDLCSDEKTQALLISHHPELIDYLLASPVGYWFDRQSNTPVRVKRIGSDNDTGLPISELIARGWLRDSA